MPYNLSGAFGNLTSTVILPQTTAVSYQGGFFNDDATVLAIPTLYGNQGQAGQGSESIAPGMDFYTYSGGSWSFDQHLAITASGMSLNDQTRYIQKTAWVSDDEFFLTDYSKYVFRIKKTSGTWAVVQTIDTNADNYIDHNHSSRRPNSLALNPSKNVLAIGRYYVHFYHSGSSAWTHKDSSGNNGKINDDNGPTSITWLTDTLAAAGNGHRDGNDDQGMFETYLYNGSTTYNVADTLLPSNANKYAGMYILAHTGGVAGGDPAYVWITRGVGSGDPDWLSYEVNTSNGDIVGFDYPTDNDAVRGLDPYDKNAYTAEFQKAPVTVLNTVSNKTTLQDPAKADRKVSGSSRQYWFGTYPYVHPDDDADNDTLPALVVREWSADSPGWKTKFITTGSATNNNTTEQAYFRPWDATNGRVVFTNYADNGSGNAGITPSGVKILDFQVAAGGAADTTAPTISSVAITAASGAQNSTLNEGDTVDVTVTFDEAVTVNTSGGTPSIAISVGGESRAAAYNSGTGTTAIVFRYTIASSETADTDGISIGANAISLNSGTMQDAAANNATLTHDAVSANSSFKVDTDKPTISSLVMASDNSTVTVTFAENVYAASNGTGDLVAADFALGLSGGNASSINLNATPSGISKTSQSEWVLTLNGTSLSTNGTGAETLTVDAANNTSIYDLAGNAHTAAASSVALNPADTVSTTVGASGGTVKAGGTAASPKAQVTIAGGALSANITVGVTHATDASTKKAIESDIRAAGSDPAFDVVSSIYSFTPHNQEFDSAVTIQFELDSVPASGLQIWKRISTDTNWYLLPSSYWSRSGTTITISTTGFSQYVAGGGSSMARTKLNDTQLAKITTSDKVHAGALDFTGSTAAVSSVGDANNMLIEVSGAAKYITAANVRSYMATGILSGSSDTQVLFNNAGAIGGHADIIFNDTVFRVGNAQNSRVDIGVDGSISGSSTLQLADTATMKAIVPQADDAYDLGSNSAQWKDLYIDGIAYIDQLGTDGDAAAAYISSGEIDGTVIGGESAAAGTFTSVTGTSLDINGAADISGDLTLSAGGDGALRFSAASSIKILDNSAASLVIEEDDNAYLTFKTSDGAEQIIFGKGATFASQTIADLGTVTTADIDGGSIDGTVIGAASAAAGTFAALVGTSLSVSDGNITNVGVIEADTIQSDADGTGLNVNFDGNTGTNKLTLKDGLADALSITDGSADFMVFSTSAETITFGKNSTFASTTIANLGTVTTADIDGGSIDGTTIGANSATSGKFTTLSASSTLQVSGDVTFGGNLTVRGDTTTVSTTNLDVKDALIMLADGTSGTPVLDAGIIIDRGTSSNASLVWDESADMWKFAALGNENGTTSGSLTITSTYPLSASAFHGDGSNLTGVGAETVAASDSNDVDLKLTFVSGAADASTFFFDTGLTFNASTNLMTLPGNIVLPNAGNIGSAGDTDAIAIAAGGAVTFSQRDVHSAGITIANDGQIGSVGDADAIAIAADGVVTFSQRDVHSGGITIADGGQIGSASDLDAMAISAGGVVTFSARDVHSAGITVADGGQIGSASDLDAMAISAGGVVTFSARDVHSAGITVADAGQIGSASDPDAIAISAAGVVALSATTAASSKTTGALTVAGGISTQADLYVGDDLMLDSDEAVLGFGDDGDVTLTHVEDTGLLLNGAMQLQFRDSTEYINSDANGSMQVRAQTDVALNINGTDELLINASTATFGTNLMLPDSSTVGCASDSDLLTLASGVVTVAGEVSMTTLDIGGTNVTATATELNVMDAGTTQATVTLAAADGVVINDADDIMKQCLVGDFATYMRASAGTLGGIQVDASTKKLHILPIHDVFMSGTMDNVTVDGNTTRSVTASLSQGVLSGSVQVFLNGLLQTRYGTAGSTWDYKFNNDVTPTKVILASLLDSDDVLTVNYIKK